MQVIMKAERLLLMTVVSLYLTSGKFHPRTRRIYILYRTHP